MWEKVRKNGIWGGFCEQTDKLEQNRFINIIVYICKIACWLLWVRNEEKVGFRTNLLWYGGKFRGNVSANNIWKLINANTFYHRTHRFTQMNQLLRLWIMIASLLRVDCALMSSIE